MREWKAIFVGDIVVQKQRERILSDELRALLHSHDLRFCNFEAPLKGKGNPIVKAGPVISQPDFAPKLVESEGFNLVGLANNHIYDYGGEGLEATLKSFTVPTTGAAMHPREIYQITSFQAGDSKVGVLALCEAEFGASTLLDTERPGYAWMFHPEVERLLLEARNRFDVLLIACHGGIENVDIPLPQWKHRYRQLIELGADAVIGGHPHVPQGWELYKGKLICYSLGNFFFDQRSDEKWWNQGLAVSLRFQGSEFLGFEIIPVMNNGQLVQTTDDPEYLEHVSQLNSLLEEPRFSQNWKELAPRLWKERYQRYYRDAVHGITPESSWGTIAKDLVKRGFFRKKNEINHALLLHNLRIESHRWVVEMALHQQIKA